MQKRTRPRHNGEKKEGGKKLFRRKEKERGSTQVAATAIEGGRRRSDGWPKEGKKRKKGKGLGIRVPERKTEVVVHPTDHRLLGEHTPASSSPRAKGRKIQQPIPPRKRKEKAPHALLHARKEGPCSEFFATRPERKT